MKDFACMLIWISNVFCIVHFFVKPKYKQNLIAIIGSFLLLGGAAYALAESLWCLPSFTLALLWYKMYYSD